jgi:hypothetical protein
MKNLIALAGIFLYTLNILHGQEPSWKGASVDFSHGKLKISENKRYLVFEDGTPFFYLGDTGWELFHRLNKDDVERYLENRRAKGFTVIQSVILAELDGLNTPDAEGDKPLIDNDPLKPNEAYFAHVDRVIRTAFEKGIFIGLLPTWGDKVDKKWGVVGAKSITAYWFDPRKGESKTFRELVIKSSHRLQAEEVMIGYLCWMTHQKNSILRDQDKFTKPCPLMYIQN